MNFLISIFLSPLGLVYWCITTLRNLLYDLGVFKSAEFDIPIISVGNLAVGGSGKTPMVEYLIESLQNKYTIAVLSRGYGRKTRGFRWVNAEDSATDVGDEPLQIKIKYEKVNVAVCEKRVDGVVQIAADFPEVNLILLDDAFQHRAIKPSINLLLSVYAKPFFKDWIMPIGRLRERRAGGERADAIIYTKCPTSANKLSWRDKTSFYSSIRYNLPKISGPIVGFSGLANNKLFQDMLSENFELTHFFGYKDHYQFTPSDLDKMRQAANGATLVCTEKDWVKVKTLAPDVVCLTITNTISGEENFIDWVTKRIKIES